MIPTDFVQELLGRVDIVDVVQRHVELKRSGANHVGLCPFHAEKSPSFSVSPAKQFYHCFGCGAHGDAIRFLMEHSAMSFRDAVVELAQSVGMRVPEGPSDAAAKQRAEAAKAQQSSLHEVLARAARHYAQQLKESPRAIDYLKRRGLSGEIAQRFGLGYAPPGWRSLASAFARYDDPLLVEAGLVIVQGDDEAEQKRYDRFRDRIVFPIRSAKGEVIGFGARVIDPAEPQGPGGRDTSAQSALSQPKYLNSPETPVFVKGRELYGLFEARQAIRAKGYALVVEGYMDVVALAQLGLAHTVATLGTACTADHLTKLFRLTDTLVFSFDGDAAGRRAAARALESALPLATDTRSLRFLFLPPEHDPDSFVRAHGAQAFEAAVAAAVPLSQQLLDQVRVGCDLDTAEGRARMLATAKPLWAALPAEGMLRRQMLDELAAVARLPSAELARTWAGPDPRRAAAPPAVPPQAPIRHRSGAPARMRHAPMAPADHALRMLLLRSPWWERLSADDHDLLRHLPDPHGTLVGWLERQLHEHGALDWADLQRLLYEVEPHAGAARRLLSAMAADDTFEFDDLKRVVNQLWRQHLQQRSDALAALGDTDPMARQELQDVWRRLQALAADSLPH